MKTLVVPQCSAADKVLSDSRTQTNGHTIWQDTNLPVQFPISLEESNRRGTRWISGVVTWAKTFDEICEMFPKLVFDLPATAQAGWGSGHYVADENGYPRLHDQDWDTSD